MKQYLDLMRHVLEHGQEVPDRTGTGTLSVFGHQMRFDLQKGFPLLTTKKLHLKSIIHELLWFLKGTGNIKDLKENGVTIWDEWWDSNGNLGPVYGVNWRGWGSHNYRSKPIDQITNLIHDLKNNPHSRRHIVSAWNVADIPDMALAPCHYAFQCYVTKLTIAQRLQMWAPRFTQGFSTEDWAKGNDGPVGDLLDQDGIPRLGLSLMVQQRSADIFLGVPFNIASYATLTMMLAQVCDYAPMELIWTGGDCHLYLNHIEQAKLQLSREPRPLPKLIINPNVKDIDDFRFEHFTLTGYDPHPHIKADVAV